MFENNVITIDFDAIEQAIMSTESPILVMNNDTLFAFISSNDIRGELINVDDEEAIYTFCGVPVSINLSLGYGEVIVK